MVEYIQRLAREFLSPNTNNAEEIYANFYALSEELARLDPRDFSPNVQYEFTHTRMLIKRMTAFVQWRSTQVLGGSALSTSETDKAKGLCAKIIYHLEHYGGEGSHVRSRSFAFIVDADLRQIIERDYKELSLVLLPGAAWKSCVVMAGSILEALLFDALTKDSAVETLASSSALAPKDKKTGMVFPIEDWRLEKLIDVAADIGVIPKPRSKAIDQSLREYRNFVHPKKEIRTGYPCTEAEAHLAQGALESILNHLEP